MSADHDLAAERDHAEFRGWLEAQGYNPDPDMVCGGDGMRDAFAAGMQAARDLAAATNASAGRQVEIEEHRWYAVIRHAGKVVRVIGYRGDSGISCYDSVAEWEADL